MTNNLLKVSCAVVFAMALTGCIDNGYDLSDIDTTTQIKVKDLVVPLNMDDIYLSDIITVKEGDKIQEVTMNGETFYAVKESGTFSSDPVEIPSFSAQAKAIDSAHAVFKLSVSSASRPKTRKAAPTFNYTLKEPVLNGIEYEAKNIDESIVEIEELGMDAMAFQLDLTLEHASSFSSAVLSNIKIAMPKGLKMKSVTPTGGTYSDGVLTIPRMELTNGKGTIRLVASGVNLPANDAHLDYDNHSLSIKSHFNIIEGEAALTPDLQNFTPLQELTFLVDYALTNFNATSFSGVAEYKIDGSDLNIDPIHLSDLPDFLADQRTNLILSNPQIYLQLNNPVGENRLGCRSGLTIVSNWDNDRKEFRLNEFNIPYDKGNGPYSFCLSPEQPASVPTDYTKNYRYVEYPGLGNVLSGKGLPASLDIKLIDPEIYRQHVTDFKLGRDLEGMDGKYLFLAPLALKGNSTEGSVIVYTDTKKDWDNSELDNITVQTLELMADVTSTIPFNAVLEAYPLDKEGNKITYKDAAGNQVPVNVKGAVIPAGADRQPISIMMEGEFTGIDGVTFEAVVRPDGNDTPLSPSQTIVLKNLKAKVGGYYTTDF